MLKHNSLTAPKWMVNDETSARRQLHYVGAFFHFRHWVDFSTTGLRTMWGRDMRDDHILPDCMVRGWYCTIVGAVKYYYYLGVANRFS